MYHHFYGLSENPFALTPDPKYLFLSPSHQEALASVVYGVHERQSFLLILGEVGTGKTTLIRHVLAQEEPTLKTACVFNPTVGFEDLLVMVLRDLEAPCQGRGRLALLDALNDFLVKEDAAGRQVVLIVDEAQHLSPEMLEELRMLSTLETARRKLLQILLVGQPELAAKLGRPELRQLRQRISIVAQLQPLTFHETCQYIADRLHIAGHTGEAVFTPRALHKLHRAAGGIPRRINAICNKSLALGYAEDTKPITGRLVQEVLKDETAFGTPAVALPKPWYQRSMVIVLSIIGLLSLLVIAREPGSALLHQVWRMLAGVLPALGF